jgi:hypothetical protein
MENGNTQNLAERIALLLRENEPASGDLGALRAGLEKINERLDALENRLSPNDVRPAAPGGAHPVFHASQEKLTSLEELADEIIKNLQNEKACPYEPTGKICDHCSMCSSRGF